MLIKLIIFFLFLFLGIYWQGRNTFIMTLALLYWVSLTSCHNCFTVAFKLYASSSHFLWICLMHKCFILWALTFFEFVWCINVLFYEKVYLLVWWKIRIVGVMENKNQKKESMKLELLVWWKIKINKSI